MVEASFGEPIAKASETRVHSLRVHNTDVRNYQPWHERIFKLHTRNLIKLGGLTRPNLLVIELGAGKYESFAQRALAVTAHGGSFTALDLDPEFVTDARRQIEIQQEKGIIHATNIHPEIANCNIASNETDFRYDVAIINSVAANATKGEVLEMRNKLQSADAEKNFSLIQYLDSLPLTNKGNDEPLPGVKGNILALINAYICLKPGGKLLYAHNDQGIMHQSTQEIRDICEKIGFRQETIRLYDPYYNSLNITDIALARSSKYDIGIVTAIK